MTREELGLEGRIADLMRRIRVQPDPGLDAHYPRRWPARVSVTTLSGQRASREVLDAPGDPGTGYGWAAIEAKLTPILGGRAHWLRSVCERLGQGALPELLESVSARSAEDGGRNPASGVLADQGRAYDLGHNHQRRHGGLSPARTAVGPRAA